MEQFLVKHASTVSTYEFFGIIALASVLECVVPKERSSVALGLRWFGNIAIYIVDVIASRLLFPFLGLGFAILCAEKGWGLFNHLKLPWWLEFALTLLLLDLANYGLHYLFHHVTPLWRIHRLHHTDQNLDFSTGIRHHPLETMVATLSDFAVILATGAMPIAVLISQWLYQFVLIFSHANLRLPLTVDRVLSHFLVTPNMHCIHHSIEIQESNSNLGNLFPWWDRVFGTFAAATVNPDGIVFGVSEFIGIQHLKLPLMIAQPFLRGSLSPQHDLNKNQSVAFRASPHHRAAESGEQCAQHPRTTAELEN